MTPDAAAALRARLGALRDDALARLAEDKHLDAGLLALAAHAGAALAALDVPPDDATAAERAVVADDGSTIRLVVYTGPELVGAVTLDPVRCIVLAQRLLDAAARRL